MQITLNGERRTIAPGSTVADLIKQLDLGQQRIAVEINSALVPRSTFPEHRIQEQDQVEIVGAIGGG